MASIPSAHRGQGYGLPLGATERKDLWWFKPLLQGAMALVAVGYSAWAGMRPGHTGYGIAHSPIHADLRLGPLLIPAPMWFMLGVPILFRATCYYFRRAYYRSIFLDPPACAVGEARKGYAGERGFPFVLQNVHRYLLYLALVFMIVHWTNTVRAFTFDGRFGVGVGSLILLADTTLLSLYTLGCHAFRHMVGGGMDCYSCVRGGEARRKAWSIVSVFNGHHMGYFWWSLYTICFADLYIRMCSLGLWHDVRLF